MVLHSHLAHDLAPGAVLFGLSSQCNTYLVSCLVAEVKHALHCACSEVARGKTGITCHRTSLSHRSLFEDWHVPVFERLHCQFCVSSRITCKLEKQLRVHT